MFEKIDGETLFLLFPILLGFLYGFLAQRKQFCFSGSIKDRILFGHNKRLATLIVAIATAIISTQILTNFIELDLTITRYYEDINFLAIIIGGSMFGYGMMVSDGCSSRHLIKFAQGDKTSLYITIVLGIFAFITYKFRALYSKELESLQILSSALIEHVSSVPVYIPIVLFAFALYKIVPKAKYLLQSWDGFLIGLLVAVGWYISSTLSWSFDYFVADQSLSFVFPIGRTIEFITEGFNFNLVVYSVWIVWGVVLGAYISSKFNSKYSTKTMMCSTEYQNPPKLWHKLLGGAMMGIGGILAGGCTAGQGLSGISTLSIASFTALASIFISGYFTAKYLHKRNGLVACFVFDYEDGKK